MNLFIRLGLTGMEKAEAGLKRFVNAGSQQARKLALSWADCGKQMSDVGSLMKKNGRIRRRRSYPFINK